MIKYIVKRLLLMLMTLVIIMTMCLIFVRLLPTPPISKQPGVDIELQYKNLVKDGYLIMIEDPDGTYQTKEEPKFVSEDGVRKYYKMPVMQALGVFWKNVITRWDWGEGTVMYTGQGDVWNVLGQKLPYTMLVNIYSVILSVPLGILLGIYAALRKNKWQDHVVSTGVMIVVSVPSYIYAFLIQYLFCYKLGWWKLFIPSESEASLLSWTMFWQMMPAILSLSFGSIAGFARYTRAELSEVLTSEYLLLARTKGLTRAQAIGRHALRNSMVVIFPMILGEFISILGGSLIIEQMFGIPGVGALYISSINRRDYNYFMALTFFYTFIGLLSGIVIDLSYGIIDPRIRMGER